MWAEPQALKTEGLLPSVLSMFLKNFAELQDKTIPNSSIASELLNLKDYLNITDILLILTDILLLNKLLESYYNQIIF